MTGPRTSSARRDPRRRFTALGLTAILAVAIVGYIAYTANSGLPLQKRSLYEIELPNANRLINSADVRIGGIRVGQVLDVTGVAQPGRRPFTRLKVALDASVERLPADTTAQVRPASVLGLTFVDLRLGRSREEIPEGGTLRLARALPSTNLTDLLDVFERGAARELRRALVELSSGVAGRGTALNATIASTSRLLPKLTAVSSTLSARPTRLPDFLRGYEAAVAALAPVSGELAGVVDNGAVTFGAVAGERAALGRAIDAAPAAEVEVTRAFTASRPALDGLARLAVRLRPAGRELPQTLREVNSTLVAGIRPLRTLPRLTSALGTALARLDTLSRDPNTSGALRKLADLTRHLRTALSHTVPAQVHCNVISLFTQGFAGVFGGLGVGDGPSLGLLFVGEAGATGEALQNAKPSPNLGNNAISNNNADECEAGNEPWTGKQQLGNPPGLQSKTTRDTVPPPGVLDRAREAGLMTDPEGVGR